MKTIWSINTKDTVDTKNGWVQDFIKTRIEVNGKEQTYTIIDAGSLTTMLSEISTKTLNKTILAKLTTQLHNVK